jgi:cation diffusion facilitator CzcD-associated flavoprotein CzcO
MSKTWFPVFALPHVTLETAALAGFTADGLVTDEGTEYPVDTVIFGTGFHAADYLRSLEVYGRGGRRLHDDWREGAEAYYGTAVPGYPNLFTLYGPNTNGVTSIIYILEAQCALIRRLLDVMTAHRTQTVEVKRDIHDAYNTRIQAAMAGTVWLTCDNYFRHPNGKVVTQFPHSGRTLAAHLEDISLDDFGLTFSETSTPRQLAPQ